MSVDVTIPQPFDDLRTRGLLTGSGNAAASAALIQARIDATGQGVVWIPAGTWYYDTAIIPKTGVALRGAGSGVTTLIYTGSGHGISALVTAVYRAELAGFTLLFGGSGSGSGIRSDRLRESVLRDIVVDGFPGSNIDWDGDNVSTGCWSNRCENVIALRGGVHNWSLKEGTNGLALIGCRAEFSNLDNFYFEKVQGVHVDGSTQAESAGRHAYHVAGAVSITFDGGYVEHRDPRTSGSQRADFSAQSPRRVFFITRAPDDTRTRSCVINGGFYTGSDGYAGNAVTTDTENILYAEHCDNLVFMPAHADYANTPIYIAPTVTNAFVLPYRLNGDSAVQYNDKVYQARTLGPRAVNYSGVVNRGEGFQNLLTNGGFDDSSASGVPAGWTQYVTGTFTRETGSDGGKRLVITNATTNESGVKQTLTGPAIQALQQAGKGVLVFDAIVPTANARDQACARVFCYESDGTTGTGGGLTAVVGLPESDTETTYVLPFAVPPSTAQIVVLFQSSNGSVSNSDVLKVDRVALYAGEVPKTFMPKPVTEHGGRLFTGLQLLTKAGAFSDSDFLVAPANNSLIGMDTSNNRVYFKCNDGTYKYATLT